VNQFEDNDPVWIDGKTILVSAWDLLLIGDVSNSHLSTCCRKSRGMHDRLRLRGVES
jgi:hypothetical protein